MLLRVGLELHHLVDLVPDLSVEVLQLIRLISQLVDVVEERVVLFLSLDERGDDFVDCCDASRLLDLLKSILDDFHIPQVLIHKSLLLSVSGDNLGETQLQDG